MAWFVSQLDWKTPIYSLESWKLLWLWHNAVADRHLSQIAYVSPRMTELLWSIVL